MKPKHSNDDPLADFPGPLYRKVKKSIKARIVSGEWPPEDRIPSENELVTALGVSRMTVHRALRELAAEGYLIRVQGVGTFVSPRKPVAAMLDIRPLKKKISLGFDGMTLEDLIAIARYDAQVTLTENAVKRIRSSRQLVDRWVKENRAIYGITTGFGALSDVSISQKDTRRLQENILMSHSSGVGSPFDPEIIRAAMALRVKDLARGHSGIRLKTVRRLMALLNHGVCPIVPQQGSVGASGDLAPLAHLALVLIGRGEALYRDQRMSGADALELCGLKPIRLESGEGLALVNGTQIMTAVGGLALYDAIRLAKLIDIAAAMSLEVLLGSRTEFDARIHQVRPHPGQRAAADNMGRIIQNSEIITSHKDCGRIQDAYTLRCSPQVHGGSRDAFAQARQTIETEMNSSTNNPLIFSGSRDFLLGACSAQPFFSETHFRVVQRRRFEFVGRIDELKLSAIPLRDEEGLVDRKADVIPTEPAKNRPNRIVRRPRRQPFAHRGIVGRPRAADRLFDALADREGDRHVFIRHTAVRSFVGRHEVLVREGLASEASCVPS